VDDEIDRSVLHLHGCEQVVEILVLRGVARMEPWAFNAELFDRLGDARFHLLAGEMSERARRAVRDRVPGDVPSDTPIVGDAEDQARLSFEEFHRHVLLRVGLRYWERSGGAIVPLVRASLLVFDERFEDRDRFGAACIVGEANHDETVLRGIGIVPVFEVAHQQAVGRTDHRLLA
jgi:hypothetical protein